MPFDFEHLEIPDVRLITPRVFPDHRGFFMETYKKSEFEAQGLPWPFLQDNFSRSNRGVLRGLHYQKDPQAQGKLVSVIRGEIFDVAVDIRRGSPTYAKWLGVRLSEQDRRMLYVPVGFAHGFMALSEDVEVLYKVTEEYAPEEDRGIVWNDPALGIDWPLENPILSTKDEMLPTLDQADNNFVYRSEE